MTTDLRETERGKIERPLIRSWALPLVGANDYKFRTHGVGWFPFKPALRISTELASNQMERGFRIGPSSSVNIRTPFNVNRRVSDPPNLPGRPVSLVLHRTPRIPLCVFGRNTNSRDGIGWATYCRPRKALPGRKPGNSFVLLSTHEQLHLVIFRLEIRFERNHTSQ